MHYLSLLFNHTFVLLTFNSYYLFFLNRDDYCWLVYHCSRWLHILQGKPGVLSLEKILESWDSKSMKHNTHLGQVITLYNNWFFILPSFWFVNVITSSDSCLRLFMFHHLSNLRYLCEIWYIHVMGNTRKQWLSYKVPAGL